MCVRFQQDLTEQPINRAISGIFEKSSSGGPIANESAFFRQLSSFRGLPENMISLNFRTMSITFFNSLFVSKYFLSYPSHRCLLFPQLACLVKQVENNHCHLSVCRECPLGIPWTRIARPYEWVGSLLACTILFLAGCGSNISCFLCSPAVFPSNNRTLMTVFPYIWQLLAPCILVCLSPFGNPFFYHRYISVNYTVIWQNRHLCHSWIDVYPCCSRDDR